MRDRRRTSAQRMATAGLMAVGLLLLGMGAAAQLGPPHDAAGESVQEPSVEDGDGRCIETHGGIPPGVTVDPHYCKPRAGSPLWD